MALPSELFKKFLRDDVSMPEKLDAAKNLFVRPEFSFLNRKEELVLDWIIYECEKNFNYDVWVVLRDCLCSHNMMRLKAIDIKTSTKVSLIELLIKSLRQEVFDGPVKKKRKRESLVDRNNGHFEEHSVIGESAILTLESDVFLFYFRKNIQKYVEFSRLTLKSASENKDVKRLLRYIKSLIHFYEQSLIKEDIYKAFIEDLFLYIIEIYSSIHDQGCAIKNRELFHDSKVGVQKEYNDVKCEILLLIKKLVFPFFVQKNIDAILFPLFEGKKIESDSLRHLFQYLIQKTSSTPDKNVSHMYSLLFEAFLTSFPDNFSAIFQFFVILCLFIGFEPSVQNTDLNRSVCLLESEKVSKILHCKLTSPNIQFSYSVLQDFISVLQNGSINLEESLKDISFKQWVQTLICNLVSNITSPVVYSIICSILELNPFIIEPIVNKILKCVLLQRKDTDEEKEAYRLFFNGLINSFIKLHKLQDLLRANIFPTLKECITECRQSNKKRVLEIPVTDVITRSFATTFGNNVGILPGKMCVTLLRMFKFELNTDVVEPMTHGEFDDGQKLYLSIVDLLLTSYLGGVRLAEQSALQPVCERFIESLEELENVMGRLGMAIIQHSKSTEALACFLRMSYAIGETWILFRIYSPWAVGQNAFQLSSTEPNCATDMHCFLSFLKSDQWNTISNKVFEFGNKACVKTLHSLLMQKLKVLSLFGEELGNATEIQSVVCGYIIDTSKNLHISIESSELALLTTLLSHKQLLFIAEHIVTDICSQPLSSEVINSVYSLHLGANFIAALGWVSVRRIADGFPKRQIECQEMKQNCLLRNILQSLDFSDILEPKKKKNKVLRFFNQLNKTLCYICASGFEDSRKEEDLGVVDYGALFCYTTLLRNLPLMFIPEEMQIPFVFSVLTLLIMLLNYSDVEKKQFGELDGSRMCVDECAATIRSICVEILQGFLEGPAAANIMELVDAGLLVQSLNRSGSCSKDILQLLFQISVQKPSILEGLAKAVCISDEYVEKNVNQYASPVSTILLETLIKKSYKNLDEVSTNKCKDTIQTLLVDVSKRIDRSMKSGKLPESGVLFLLESYLCVLSAFTGEVSFVLKYVDSFISCAFSLLKNEDSSNETKKTAELLLELVMQNQEYIKRESRNHVLLEAFKLSNNSQLLANMLMCADDEDFGNILGKISKFLVTQRKRPKKFPDLDLFTALINLPMPYHRAKSIEGIIVLVSYRASKMILRGDHKEKVLKFVKFLIAVCRRPKVPLPSAVADIILTIAVCAVDVSSNSLEVVISTIHDVVRLLISMVTCHFPLLEDRIPAFLLAYRAVLHFVVMNSADNIHLEYEDSENLAKSVHHLELLSKEVAKQSKHFKLISQFIVADLLLELQQTSINNKIKFHIMNSMYSFLQMCDEFAVSHLSQALPPASLELFKSILNDYKMYHHYTGKV